jgi:chromosomal replication initiation ATPase DnaA
MPRKPRVQFPVAAEHEVEASSYIGFRSRSPGRDVAALLCRELTCSTLADLSHEFGLRHPDSSANLIRRAKRQLRESKSFKKGFERLKRKLLKTENQV